MSVRENSRVCNLSSGLCSNFLLAGDLQYCLGGPGAAGCLAVLDPHVTSG